MQTPVSYSHKFDAFSDVEYENNIEYEYYQKYTPVTALQEGSENVVEFAVLGSKVSFIDTTKTRLRARIKITEQNPKVPITEESDVGPINSILLSAWRSIQLQIGGVTFTNDISHCQPFKEQMEILTQKDWLWLDSVAVLGGVDLDTPGHHNTLGPLAGANRGLKNRATFFNENGSMEFEAYLPLDAFKLTKFLPPSVPFSIKLFQSSDEFFLLRGLQGDKPDERYRFFIESASLYVYYVRPNVQLRNMFEEALSQKAAMYEYPHVTMKPFVVAANVRSVSIDNILVTLPNQILCALIDNRAFSGSYDLNPFAFESFLTDTISLTYEGVEVNGKPYKLKLRGQVPGHLIPDQEYDGLFHALYSDGLNSKGGILAPKDFRMGNFIMKWDMNKSIKPQESLQEKIQGLTRLTLSFAEPLQRPITVLLYTVRRGVFSINKARTVTIEA